MGFSSITIRIPSRSRQRISAPSLMSCLTGVSRNALKSLQGNLVLLHALLRMAANGHVAEFRDVAVEVGHLARLLKTCPDSQTDLRVPGSPSAGFTLSGEKNVGCRRDRGFKPRFLRLLYSLVR